MSIADQAHESRSSCALAIGPKADYAKGMLPASLAAPPWVKKRKRVVFDLVVEQEPDAFAKVFRHGFVSERMDDDYLAIPEREREAHVLSLFEDGKIKKIYAARHLGAASLRRVMSVAPESCVHYQVVEKLLSLEGWDAWEALATYGSQQPWSAQRVFGEVDSTFIGWHLAGAALQAPKETATTHRHAFEFFAASQPRAAVCGVAAWVVGADAKIHKKALSLLKRRIKAGARHRGPIESMFGAAVADEIDVLLAPPPLPSRMPKMPVWWQPGQLQAPRLQNGTTIEGEALAILGGLMSLLPGEAARRALDEVVREADEASFDAFALGAMEAWIAAGAKTKDKWAIFALGLCGGERGARRLLALAAEWSAEGFHARSGIALEAVANIGSDAALLRLSELTHLKKGALKKRAKKVLLAYAEARGWDEDELEDRLVPHLGLDAEGKRTLSYGARSFQLGFDEMLVPYFVDESGDRLANMPRPNKNDDADAAAEAKEAFKELRADAKIVGKRQAAHLERAMRLSRRWSTERWRELFVEHPLNIHYARRLVFGAFDEKGELCTGFRIDEEGSFADARDETIELSEVMTQIGIVHPLTLGTAATTRFSEVFADYEILQPFPQLGRALCAATEEELASSSITRFVGRKVEGKRFFNLKRRGWEFPDYDIGRLLSSGRTVFLRMEPGLEFLGYGTPGEQLIGSLDLVGDNDRGVRFSALDPIELSELLNDLGVLF